MATATPVKFSPEWFEAKKQARKDLDYKLSLGVRHGDKKVVAPEAPEAEDAPAPAPKAPKAVRKPKAPKA